MDDYESLSHTTWTCKYHVVFIPKCRRKTLYLELRRHLGEVFHKLALQRESKVEEGHLMPDHVHMLLSTEGPNGLKGHIGRGSRIGQAVENPARAGFRRGGDG